LAVNVAVNVEPYVLTSPSPVSIASALAASQGKGAPVRKRATQNRYDGLLEPWKIQLITSRAKRLGFRRHDLEDVQQEVIMEVVAFRFDPSKGAGESTPLTAMIDHRLKTIRRKAARYAAKVANAGDALTLEKACLVYEDSTAVRLDVMTAMTRLTGEEIAICLRLIQGQSVRQIARQLKRGWHSVNRTIRGIRRRFQAMGLGH